MIYKKPSNLFGISLAIATILPTMALAATHNVSTNSQLRSALSNASNGDTIVIAAGTYQPSSSLNTNTLSQANGGANRVVAPQFMLLNKSNITIRGASSSNRPTLKGTGITDGKYVFYAQKANGLVLKDIKFQNATKGVIIDRSDNVTINNIRVENIGNEGLHFRDGSDGGETKFSEFYKIGMDRKDRGEALYICNDKKKWHPNYTTTSDDIYQENCDNHTIRNNEFLGEIGAEHIDIKEGTRGHNIHDNTFTAKITNSTLINATGDFAKSIIHDKGYNNRIHNNTFNMANMKWYSSGGEWAAIRVEQVLNDGEYRANLYGHNGGYVYNTLTNSNNGSSDEFIVLGPSDGANNAKVGCDTINGSNPKYRVLSQSKSGLEIDGGIGNTGSSVVSGSTCDNYTNGAGGSSTSSTSSTSSSGSTAMVHRDTYIRDGAYADDNYTTDLTLQVKKAGTGYNREAVIKIDRSAISGSVTSAKLKFKIALAGSCATTNPAAVYEHTDSWSDTNITWNFSPGKGAHVKDFYTKTAGNWVEVDVKNYFNTQQNQSHISFLVANKVDGGGCSNWEIHSKESGNGPRVIVTQ